MSRINSNVPALRAIHQLSTNQRDLSIRLERLATGLRINRGADDPAGLIASEALRTEIRGLEQSIDNSVRASNVIATAEGSLTEVSALLVQLQELLVASANSGALTDAEITANQLEIDSILESIDRISNTTTFGGRKLLDGSGAYTVSSVDDGAIAALSVFTAHIPRHGTQSVTVQVTQSAQTAQVSFVGVGQNSNNQSFTSATTIEIRGALGSDILSFASGATLDEIRTAINSLTSVTGVSAVLSSPGGGGVSAIILNSTTYGSDALVSVSPISGNFIEANNAEEIRDTGRDAGVVVNGHLASVQGLVAQVRSTTFDGTIHLTSDFGTVLSSATFHVTGGGSLFQLAPEVAPNGQVNIAFNRVASTSLGNNVTGLLYSLRSGQENDLHSKNFLAAQNIVAESVQQVASLRGRLGNFQRNKIETNINSQRIALENVTASESLIRDADIATEVAALTRAEILVQTTQATLQIAASAPRAVLALLG